MVGVCMFIYIYICRIQHLVFHSRLLMKLQCSGGIMVLIVVVAVAALVYRVSMYCCSLIVRT